MADNHQAPLPLLHPNITIQPPNPSLLPAYKRLITNLLPIPYPPQFYTASLPPFSNSFALLAVWRSDAPNPTFSSTTSTAQSLTSSSSSRLSSSSPSSSQEQQSEVVIGGIQGRIEHQSSSSSSLAKSEGGGNNNGNNNNDDDGGGGRKVLYIQTLAVLAPYRGLGVGKALLERLIEMVLKQQENDETGVVGEVYAHVWEANEEGVEWYVKRGFVVVGGVVESYYRRLRPQGARVVRRRVGVGDWVRVRMDK